MVRAVRVVERQDTVDVLTQLSTMTNARTALRLPQAIHSYPTSAMAVQTMQRNVLMGSAPQPTLLGLEQMSSPITSPDRSFAAEYVAERSQKADSACRYEVKNGSASVIARQTVSGYEQGIAHSDALSNFQRSRKADFCDLRKKDVDESNDPSVLHALPWPNAHDVVSTDQAGNIVNIQQGQSRESPCMDPHRAGVCVAPGVGKEGLLRIPPTENQRAFVKSEHRNVPEVEKGARDVDADIANSERNLAVFPEASAHSSTINEQSHDRDVYRDQVSSNLLQSTYAPTQIGPQLEAADHHSALAAEDALDQALFNQSQEAVETSLSTVFSLPFGPAHQFQKELDLLS